MAAEETAKLAARVILRLLAKRYRVAFERRIGGAAICGILAMSAGLAAAAFGLGALWIWIGGILGPAISAAICMGFLMFVMLVFALLARHFARSAAPPLLEDLLTSKEVAGVIDRHLPELMIAAALSGLILGMRRRR